MICSMTGSARRKFFACIGALSLLFASAAGSRVVEPKTGLYQIVASVSGAPADGLWDYATIDGAARRLYLAQNGVTVLDLDTGKVTPHFVKGRTFQGLGMSHHAVPVNGGKVLAVTDAGANSVDFFDARTGAIMSSVSVGPVAAQNWHNPDSLLRESKSDLLICVNGDSSSLSLIDTKTFTKVGDIPVGKGKLETAAADGAGLVYVNEEGSGSIAVVDVAERKVIREIAMQGCEEPTGMVYDSKDRLVISVCSNGVVKFIAADSDKEVASITVGAGADGLAHDPERNIVFSFGGDVGTLSVIALQGRNNIALVQTLKTKPGARLGALDPKTGRIYIPSASFGPPAAPIKLPGMEELPGLNPHTFEFIVVAPTAP
jgi:DNA-binding beta-propeller fold protein YncE